MWASAHIFFLFILLPFTTPVSEIQFFPPMKQSKKKQNNMSPANSKIFRFSVAKICIFFINISAVSRKAYQ